MRRGRWRRVGMGVVLAFAVGKPGRLAAQEVEAGDTAYLSLDDAVGRALGGSEEVRLARSQVSLADAQVTQARAQALPQVDISLGYTKTLASAFDTGGGFELPDSLRFEPDTTATLEERVRYLEQTAPLAGLGGIGSLFSNLPFGQENAYSASLVGSQLLYSGGRVGAALDIARSYRSAARLNLAEELAEIELQVRRAYWDARLARELEAIGEEALAQAERFLAEERLRYAAGRASELELMRAEVARDNLRPQLVAARNGAELAALELKRLVELPLEQPIRLTTDLEAPAAAEAEAEALAPEVLIGQRAAIRAAEEQVEIRQQQVRISRGGFLPSVSLNMNYGRQLFPSDPFTFSGDWRTDWTIGLGVQIPVFSGFRRVAELEAARVELERARLQASQLRESVQLQYEAALGERRRAREEIAARQRTAEVAERVYELTVLRYDRGLATQLEVSDARLALLQARTNLAQAVRDYYVADAGLTRAQTDPAAAALPTNATR